MKHSDNFPRVAAVLMWVLPFLLLVPNIALDITELLYSPWARITNALLPFGLYLLASAWGARIGRKILFFIPLMVLCAFQIVLLFLYGEAIIAIDMFLNVATTNVHEAGELLANLGPAIVTVLALYLPLIAAGIWAEVRKARVPRRMLVVGRRTGLVVTLLGLASFGLAFTAPDGYRPLRQLFPANVIYNMVEATERTAVSSAYPEASAGYKFHCMDADTVQAYAGQVVVMVVGETSRAGHWSLGGYERKTTPRLEARDHLVFFPRTLSESNTTHKSVPLMLSHLTAEEFGDSAYVAGSVVDAFHEAGYATAWISNQAHNHSLIDFYSSRADDTDYLCDAHPVDDDIIYDTALAPRLKMFIDSQEPSRKLFIVVHTYGSHFNYKERYAQEDAMFHPDNSVAASRSNREELINAYDNSILATDKALDALIEVLEESGRPSVMVYAADHGEDIFDDSRDRFLHASPNPTYYQIHVPMFVWMTDGFASTHPRERRALEENSGKNVSSSESVFHTLVSLADLRLPVYNSALALSSDHYQEPRRRYLNDYDESVPLVKSGLHKEDLQMLDKMNISTK
ncbi:MAG: lipid A phosphoethanolamine transferase [Muribaculaceae bacterium]|nr:lipid A phosphoethanolamine transferase [Muribaculaceae bacterium]